MLLYPYDLYVLFMFKYLFVYKKTDSQISWTETPWMKNEILHILIISNHDLKETEQKKWTNWGNTAYCYAYNDGWMMVDRDDIV